MSSSVTHPVIPPSRLYSTNAPYTNSAKDDPTQAALEEHLITTLTGFSMAPSGCKCCIKESTLSLFAAAILFSTAFLTLTPVMGSTCNSHSNSHDFSQIMGSVGTFFSLALLSRAAHARYRCGSSQEVTPFLGNSKVVHKWGITYTILHKKGAEKRYVFGYAFLALVNASCLIATSILCAHQT